VIPIVQTYTVSPFNTQCEAYATFHYVALLPTISSSDSSSYPVRIQDSSLHRPVPSEYVEPHASSARPAAPTSFPVEVSHSPQYVNTISLIRTPLPPFSTTISDFLYPASPPHRSQNLEPLPTLTPKRKPPHPSGLLPVRRNYSVQFFRGPDLFHAEDAPELHGSGPISTRLPHHGHTAHTTSRWKF
jgi:hypothetical protein